MRQLNNVNEFQVAFGHSVPTEITLPPKSSVVQEVLKNQTKVLERSAEYFHKAASECSGDTTLLRMQLLTEELAELSSALTDGNKTEVLDALCDLQYVLLGAVLTFGYGEVFEAAFQEVHRSNMSKLDANGQPIKNAAGRVVKSEFFKAPDLSVFVKGV